MNVIEGMNLFERNFAVIRKHFPGLEKQLDAESSADMEALVRVEKAVSGEPTLAVNGVYVHSKYSPEKEGRRLAEAAGAESSITAPVIVLGFGLGYAATAAAEKYPNRPLIVVEKHSLFLKKALETRDMTAFLEQNTIGFVIGGPEDNVLSALQLFENNEQHKELTDGQGKEPADEQRNREREQSGKNDRPFIIKNRSLIGLDSQWYAEVERHINTWTSRDAVNEATLKRFGKRWERNFERNKQVIRDIPGIVKLKGLLQNTGIPVLLAAAGPSLDNIKDVAPEFSKRCLVIGVDTSLRFLLKAGVTPDFTVSADPQYWNARHLDCAWQMKTGTCLVTETAVYPLAVHIPFKWTLLYGSHYPPCRELEEKVDPKGYLGSGGSVATTAFDLGLSLGTASIFIAGLDLSFPHLKTHFKGALFEEKANAEAMRLCPAETRSIRALRDGGQFFAASLSGGMVLTDKRLSLYAAWFESRLRSAPVRASCLSGEGLAITGMNIASYEDILRLPIRRQEINHLLDRAFTEIGRDFQRKKAEREVRFKEWR